jgi:ribosome-binding protein aMBF1 (putative translation factor)
MWVKSMEKSLKDMLITSAARETLAESSTRDVENNFGGGTVLLTGKQIRMARAALGWSAHDLCVRTGLGSTAVQKAESVEGMPAMRTVNLAKIKNTFERAGIVFFDGTIPGVPGTGPGVRVRN